MRGVRLPAWRKHWHHMVIFAAADCRLCLRLNPHGEDLKERGMRAMPDFSLRLLTIFLPNSVSGRVCDLLLGFPGQKQPARRLYLPWRGKGVHNNVCCPTFKLFISASVHSWSCCWKASWLSMLINDCSHSGYCCSPPLSRAWPRCRRFPSCTT